MPSHFLGKIFPSHAIYCISTSHYSPSHTICRQPHLRERQKKPLNLVRWRVVLQQKEFSCKLAFAGQPESVGYGFVTLHSSGKLCSAAFPPALQGKASQTAFHPHRHLLSIWEELGSVIHLYTIPFIAALVSPLNNSTQDTWQSITVNGVVVESRFWKILPQAKYYR